jgi:serine protease Do
VVSVTLGELPTAAEKAPVLENEPASIDEIELEPLTPRMARELGLPTDLKGVLVVDLEPGSAEADAGLRPGDVIVEVDRQPVTSVEVVEHALRNRGTRPVVLLVNRLGRTVYVVVDSR